MSYSVQIRRYKNNGEYSRTVKVSHKGASRTGDTIKAWLATHTFHELESNLQTNPCNIMVRRDGKLISYKEFM